MFGCALNAGAADFTVTDCGDTGNPNQLRAKIQAANGLPAGGSIEFACGPATIVLANELPVIGKPISIDGGGKITISGGNTVRHFIVNVELSLEDIALTHGLADDGGSVLVAVTGELYGRNVAFEDNNATNDGGAIYANYGSVLLVTSQFRSNHAVGDGGGIYNHFSMVELQDVDFTENTSGAYSGAISNDSGYVSWIGGTAYKNQGAECGVMDTFDSGEELAQGQAEITRVTFIDNKVTVGNGGALVVFTEAAVDAWDCTFQDNEAAQNGGAVANYGYFQMTGGTFLHNNATTGGAVRSTDVTFFNNVTFSDNYADVAQTLSAASDVYLNRVTLVGADIGTGANIQAIGSGKFYLTNSILMRPTAGGVNCSELQGAYVSQGFNRVDDNSCGFNSTGDMTSVDPKLGPIADNGGPTLTHLPLPGGSLVDAGNMVGCPDDDQRGIDRPQQAACDIGAVEIVGCDPPVPQVCGDPTGDGQVKTADALKTLRASVGSAKCGLWLCDYSGNGSISAGDALAILKAAVGQPTSPGCPQPWDCRAELYS